MSREDAVYLNPAEMREELKEYAALSFNVLESLATTDAQFRFSPQDLGRMLELRHAYLTMIEQATVEAATTRLRRVK